MRGRALVLVVMLGVVFCGGARGASLGVSPSGFMIAELQPGREYDLDKEAGVRLTINNGNPTTQTFVVGAYKPSQRGRWEKGYLEIPDPSWCRFDQPEVVVGPNSKGQARLFVKIPNEEKYFNQRWVVTFGIEGKSGAGGIALAVDVRAQLETASKPEPKERPDGPFGFAPSLIRFENVPPGEARTSDTVVYNNEETTRSYQVTRLLADPAIRAQTYQTQSYRPLPDRGWLALEREKLTIGPGGTARLGLTLNVPAGAEHADKRWEEILLVQPEQEQAGPAGLIRVQVTTGGQ